MKLILLLFCFVVLCNFARADLLGLNIGHTLVQGIQAVVGSFADVLYQLLSPLDIFVQVYNTNMTPEEVGRAVDEVAEPFFKEAGVPFNDQIVQEMKKEVSSAFSKGISSQVYFRACAFMLEDILTKLELLELEMTPSLALNFVTILTDTVFSDDMSQFEFPYVAGNIITHAKFLKSYKNLKPEDIERMAKKYYDGLHQNEKQ